MGSCGQPDLQATTWAMGRYGETLEVSRKSPPDPLASVEVIQSFAAAGKCIRFVVRYANETHRELAKKKKKNSRGRRGGKQKTKNEWLRRMNG